MGGLLSALTNRCPNCHKGSIRKHGLTMAESCSVCHVRFERWSGNWLFPVVLAYGVGGVFAAGLMIAFLKAGALAGSENIIIPATLVVTLLSYPLCQNLTVWLLWATGLVFTDSEKRS